MELSTKQRQILEAALGCFARKGFHGTAMSDIVEATGMSPGSIYRYFESKDEIIVAAAEASLSGNVALIEALKESDEILADFDRLLGALLGVINSADQAALSLGAEFWAEALRNPRVAESVRAQGASTAAALASVFRHAQEQGRMVPAVDPDVLAKTLMALVSGLALHKGLEPGLPLDVIQQTVHLLLKPLFQT